MRYIDQREMGDRRGKREDSGGAQRAREDSKRTQCERFAVGVGVPRCLTSCSAVTVRAAVSARAFRAY